MPLSPRARAALVAATVVALAGCESDRRAPGWTPPGRAAASEATPPAAATGPRVVVARVNGAPITAADLALAMTSAARASNPHAADAAPATPPVRAEVLDRLIGEELAAQRARARGLDAEPAFQDELGSRQAQLDAFRRQRLAILLERAVRAEAAVSEAAARRFFDERADRIRTETRVWQILLHDRAAIEQARRELDGGAAFEAVAARGFPHLPPGTTPWDLGYLKWNQLPEPWVPVLDGLAVGATSPIIEGPRGRLWLLKVVDRRVDPALTFERARPAIEVVLQARAADAAAAALQAELRAGAAIELTPP